MAGAGPDFSRVAPFPRGFWLLFVYFLFYVPACVSVPRACSTCRGQRRVLDLLELKLWATMCGCRELNPGPQEMLLTTDPSLWPTDCRSSSALKIAD